MILKLIERNDYTKEMMDDDPFVGCRIIDDVQEVQLTTTGTGEATINVQYRQPNRGMMTESFVLIDNAYLMNDGGKTIQTFHAVRIEKPVAEVA